MRPDPRMWSCYTKTLVKCVACGKIVSTNSRARLEHEASHAPRGTRP